MIHRRAFISGLVSALAAPAIVHAGNLMPIRGTKLTQVGFGYGTPSVWWVVEKCANEHGCFTEKYRQALPGDPLYDRLQEMALHGDINRYRRLGNAYAYFQGKGDNFPVIAEYPALDNSVPVMGHTDHMPPHVKVAYVKVA